MIGVAWKPHVGQSAGGICELNAHYRETDALPEGDYSLNTVMVTQLNQKEKMTDGIMSLTLVHELGHAFGAEHDEDVPERPDCLPSDDSPHGKFVMSATVSEGEPKDHNWMFSLCSRQAMEPVVAFKGTCLKLRQAYCGNSLVEHNEECDCGTSFTCESHDKCCTPRDMKPFTGGTAQPEQGCRLKKGSKCSPRVHRCCTEGCGLVKRGVTCRKMTDCTSASECDGQSPSCPAPKIFQDGTSCAGGLGKCKGGVCSKSPCEQAGLVDCLCQLPVNHVCSVCCRCATGPEGICVPAQWLLIAAPSYSLLLPPGAKCAEGVCDNDARCVLPEVDYKDEEYEDEASTPGPGEDPDNSSDYSYSYFYEEDGV